MDQCRLFIPRLPRIPSPSLHPAVEWGLCHAPSSASGPPAAARRGATSFIARAKAAQDASVLLGPFRSAGRFDACLEAADMRCTAIGPGGAECELTVTEAVANAYGTLHGGCVATVVDVVGTLALLGVDPTRPGVSVEMNQSFCAAAAVGDRVRAVGQVLRYGRTLGFTEVTLSIVAPGGDGKLVAVGRHTKVFPPS